jgi:DNA-directed RNA polymerase specialized sigma24 family protein
MSYPGGMTTPPFDPTRAAELYRLFAKPVYRRLQCRCPWADPEWLADAVVDAVLALAATSDAVNERMVCECAYGKVGTHLRSEQRRLNREKNAGSSVTKPASAAASVLEELAVREQLRLYEDRIARTPAERELLALWAGAGIHPAAAAAAIGLSEAEVRKMAARLRKRLSRERELAATEAS